MKKIIFFAMGLVVLMTSQVSYSKWVCCQDMGGSSVSCEKFETREECIANCKNGDCQRVAQRDKVDRLGGISVDDLDIEHIDKKYIR